MKLVKAQRRALRKPGSFHNHVIHLISLFSSHVRVLLQIRDWIRIQYAGWNVVSVISEHRACDGELFTAEGVRHTAAARVYCQDGRLRCGTRGVHFYQQIEEMCHEQNECPIKNPNGLNLKALPLNCFLLCQEKMKYKCKIIFKCW